MYDWAKEYKLTDASSEEEMRLRDVITRAEMSKIITKFSENVMNKYPEKRESCKEFTDLEGLSEDLKEAVISSCEL